MGKKWTREEEDFLIQNYQYMSDVKMLAIINRLSENPKTMMALKLRRSRLGLIRNEDMKSKKPLSDC